MKKNKDGLMSKLIFLSLITTIIVTTMSLSKYQSTLGGTSNTTVAIYAMAAYTNENTDEDLVVDCAGERNLQLTDGYSYVITNEVQGKVAEVAVKYKIKVEFEDELPTGITIDVTDENGNKGDVTKLDNSYIFENAAWKFTAGVSQQNIITINFNGENIENATSSMISNVQVSVIIEQID